MAILLLGNAMAFIKIFWLKVVLTNETIIKAGFTLTTSLFCHIWREKIHKI